MRRKDCEVLSALWMDGAAKLTGGIILTKSDKTEKRGLKVPHLFSLIRKLLLSFYIQHNSWIWELLFLEVIRKLFF